MSDQRRHLTGTQLDEIASAIGADLITPYLPPARPFTVGDQSTWGIHRDYRSQIPEPSVAVVPAAIDVLSRRLAASLGATAVESVSTLWPDLSSAAAEVIAVERCRDAVVICADVLQRLDDPSALLNALRTVLERATLVVVSVPLRALTMTTDDLGPPANTAHAREWTFPELLVCLDTYGIEPLFGGVLRSESLTPNESPTGVVIAACRTPTAGHLR